MKTQKKNLTQKRQLSLGTWMFLFGVNYAFWHLVIVFFNFEIQHRFMVAELLDLFTPIVMTFFVLKIIWNLKTPNISHNMSRFQLAGYLLVILGLLLFIEGHGIHLSANAIMRHLVGEEGSSIFKLTYFFDEIMGHVFWDTGFILVSLAFIILSLDGESETYPPALIPSITEIRESV